MLNVNYLQWKDSSEDNCTYHLSDIQWAFCKSVCLNANDDWRFPRISPEVLILYEKEDLHNFLLPSDGMQVARLLCHHHILITEDFTLLPTDQIVSTIKKQFLISFHLSLTNVLVLLISYYKCYQMTLGNGL